MEVTNIGFLLLPFGAILFCLAPLRLYDLAVVSIPFTATSLLNSSSGAPLTAFQYFGGFFILSYWISFFYRWLSMGDTEIKIPEYNSLFYIVLFFLIAIITMAMPLYIDGYIRVDKGDGTSSIIPVELTIKNFKNIIPLVFGFSFAITLVFFNNTIYKLTRTLKIYLIGIFFFMMLGIFQFIIQNIFNYEYPAWIFNTAINNSALGYLQTTARGWFRVSSASLEPSMFAKQLLSVIPIVGCFWLDKSKIFNHLFLGLMLFFLIGMLFLSLTTTGYLGVPILIILYFIFMPSQKTVSKKVLFLFLFFFLLFFTLIVMYFYDDVWLLLDELIFGKFETNSGKVRFNSIMTAWGYVLEYPILGLGWGFVTSNDLFIYLLANSGILGLLTFITMISNPILRALALRKNLIESNSAESSFLFSVNNGIIISQLTIILTATFTGYEFYFPNPYFILGFSISVNRQICLLKK